MDERLLTLTCAALAGLASQPRASHRDADDPAHVGKRAVDLARAAIAALDEVAMPETAEPNRPRRR